MKSNRCGVYALVLVLGALLVGCSATEDQVLLEALKAPNAVFALDFEDGSDAADLTPTSAGWVVDRRAPESWIAVDSRLHIDIDETKETTGFYRFQGKKYQDAAGTYWYAGKGSRFSYSFYVDPAWESDGIPQETGVWPVLGNADGGISAYPILAYQDSDASDTGEARFRAFVYETDQSGIISARWVDLGIPKQLRFNPDEGGWVNVEAQLHRVKGGSALKWRVNNRLIADERGYNVYAPSTQFLEFIFNSVNFGVDQTYEYDNIRLTKPGRARF